MHPRIILILFLFLTVLVTLITIPGLCFAADSGNVIYGNVQYADGSKYGIGDGFYFAFDRNGTPCITYYDRNRGSLKYARVEKGKWDIETVADSGYRDRGLIAWLCFDRSNNPYISFLGQDETLKLATKKSGRWEIETVDSTPGSGLYCSMAISPGGDPIIAYQGKDGTMLARKMAASWSREKIDDAGEKTLVFIKPSGEICLYYIGYGEKSPAKTKEGSPSDKREPKAKKDTKPVDSKEKRNTYPLLRYATKKGAGWELLDVPNSEQCFNFDVAYGEKGAPIVAFSKEKEIIILQEAIPGSRIWRQAQIPAENCKDLSVVVSKSGLASLSFIGSSAQELLIARNNGAEWIVKKVASAQKGYKFKECQLVRDLRDRDLIILYDENSLNVFLEKGEGWGFGRIDGKNQVGGYINLAIDPKGNPCLCYYDYTRKELRFAYREGGKWQVSLVDGAGDVGRFASMALDAFGNPHIAYYDAGRGDLKYAWRQQGVWKSDRVDHKGDIGVNISLTLGQDGIPKIAYKDKTSSLLKYASLVGNKWKIEKVAKLGEYGERLAILSLPSGETKIVYVDGDRVENAPAGQSPVRTYIRVATQKGENKWFIEELAGPYAVSITQSALSADVNKNGDIAISYLDRDGRLNVLIYEQGTWRIEKFNDLCWDVTSTKFQVDGALKILYLAGRSKEEPIIRLVSHEKNAWKIFEVALSDKKINSISLTSSPDGKVRFAFGDLFYYLAGYFEQR